MVLKSAKKKKIQAFQSICLGQITPAPCYVSNHYLRKDPNICTVDNLTITHSILSLHSNQVVANQYTLSIPGNCPRRLKDVDVVTS